MRRLAWVLWVAAAPAYAVEGFYFALDVGAASWDFDAAALEARLADHPETFVVGCAAGCRAVELVGSLQSGPAAQLRIGYNVLGHGSVEAFVFGAGWDLGTGEVGGGGVVGLSGAWHPLQLWLPDRRFDVALGLGAGYGIVGERRAVDGAAMVLGLGLEWIPVPFFALTLGVRHVVSYFDRYVVDWDDADQPWGAAELAESADGSATVFHGGVKFLFTPRRE